MSGCTNTSRIGSSPSAIAVSGTRVLVIVFERSARKPASARTNTTFPNSEGWKVKKPTLIHRFEPCDTEPRASTSSITPSVTP